MEEQPFNILERCKDSNPARVKAREEVHTPGIFTINTLNIEAHLRSDVMRSYGISGQFPPVGAHLVEFDSTFVEACVNFGCYEPSFGGTENALIFV
jgi:hypothetical protein